MGSRQEGMRFAASLVLALLASLGCDGAATEPISPPPIDAPTSGANPDDCPAEGWCWARGRPLRVDADLTHGAVYAVGPDGTLLRWENEGWTAHSAPTSRGLLSAWVNRADDLWVSDDHGSAWHLDGSTWTERPADVPILALIGADDGALWAKAAGQAAHGGAASAGLLRWTGTAWESPMAPHAYCIGGDFLLFGREIWSAGLGCDEGGGVNGLQVRRWDGASWALVGEPIAGQAWYPTLSYFEGRVVVEAQGRFEWDGDVWIASPRPMYPQQLPPNETAIWDGLGHSIMPRALACTRAFRMDADHAWCFGGGQIFVQSGLQWSPTLIDPFGGTQSPARWGTLPPALWAGSDTERAWGSGPTDVYRVRASAGRKLEHFDGDRWSVVVDEEVRDLGGTAAADVWIATVTRILHFDGRDFSAVPAPAGEVLRIHALPTGRVLALTEDALMLYDGAWTTLFEAPDRWRLSSIAGSSSSDLWLLRSEEGRSNTVALEHFDGARWEVVEVEDLNMFGELTTTTTGETWVLTDGFVQRLGNNGARFPLGWRAFSASLWIGAGAVWISTPEQALRHPLP